MGERRGLLIVFTGGGKGKTTAAIGLAVRALGSGMRTSIIQFIKEWETGEHRALPQLSEGRIEVLRMGSGFVFSRPAPAEAVEAARKAVETARERLTGGNYDIVVVDEIFAAVEAGLISEKEVLGLAEVRPAGVHLVMTGRGAPQSIVERADTVTEMRAIKHHYTQGVKAQAGIEL